MVKGKETYDDALYLLHELFKMETEVAYYLQNLTDENMSYLCGIRTAYNWLLDLQAGRDPVENTFCKISLDDMRGMVKKW